MMDVAEAARRATSSDGLETGDEPAADPAASPDTDQLEEVGQPDLDLAGTGNNRAPAGTLAGLEDWLLDTPEGNYLETDAREYWDPDGGGRTRLMFHISDLAGVTGIPNWLGLCIAIAEMYVNHEPSDDQESSDEEPESGEMMTASSGAEEM